MIVVTNIWSFNSEIIPRKFDVHIEDEDLHLTNVEEVTSEVSLNHEPTIL